MDDLTLKDRAVLSVCTLRSWQTLESLRTTNAFDLTEADVGVSVAVLLERGLIKRHRTKRRWVRLTDEGVRWRNSYAVR